MLSGDDGCGPAVETISAGSLDCQPRHSGSDVKDSQNCGAQHRGGRFRTTGGGVLSCQSSGAVCRSGQRHTCPLGGRFTEVFCGITHSIDLRVGSLMKMVGEDSSGAAELQPGVSSQLHVRPYPESENDG